MKAFFFKEVCLTEVSGVIGGSLFIYLFIDWSSRVGGIFLCYHSTTLGTFKDEISASAICHLWRSF